MRLATLGSRRPGRRLVRHHVPCLSEFEAIEREQAKGGNL